MRLFRGGYPFVYGTDSLHEIRTITATNITTNFCISKTNLYFISKKVVNCRRLEQFSQPKNLKTMFSKIKIDVDGYNNPVIRLDVSSSTEDLRDKMAQAFIRNRGYESNLYLLRNTGASTGGSSGFDHYELSPIKRCHAMPHPDGGHPEYVPFEHLWDVIAYSLGLEQVAELPEQPHCWVDKEGSLYDLTKYGFVKRGTA